MRLLPIIKRRAFAAEQGRGALVDCWPLRLACATVAVLAVLGSPVVQAQPLPDLLLTEDVISKVLPHLEGGQPTASDSTAQRTDAEMTGGGGDQPGSIGLIQAPKGAAAGYADGLDALSGEQLSFSDLQTADLTALEAGPLSHPPVVVELFTSQGCSSCPVADDLLAHLAERQDVLALSWHVDYWDYLGWPDGFARPEFTHRQKAYARAVGERSVYTPQFMVGGAETLIRIRPADLMALIDNRMAQPVAVSVSASGTHDAYQIELTPRARPGKDIAILLVRYAPKREVKIEGGENNGMTLTYRNVVLAVERVATWDGKAPLRLNITASGAGDQVYPEDTKHAILAQQVGRKGRASGAILTAVRLD